MGNIALLALTNRVGITKWRGSVIESTLVPGLKVIGTFHPATFIPPKFNFLNKPLICEDLTRAKHEAEFKELRRTSRSITIRPDFDQALNTLRHCYKIGLLGRSLLLTLKLSMERLIALDLDGLLPNPSAFPFDVQKVITLQSKKNSQSYEG